MCLFKLQTTLKDILVHFLNILTDILQAKYIIEQYKY